MTDYISREAALQALCEAVHADDEYIPCRNQIMSCQWKGTRIQEYAEKILAIPAADVVPWEWLERYADWFCANVSYPEFIGEAKRFYEASLKAMEGGHIGE